MLPKLDDKVVRQLHRKAKADRWDVAVPSFARKLEESVTRSSEGRPAQSPRDVERYARSLRLEDLALACACQEGHEGAWEHFVREYRPTLYRAADAIDPTGGARDLADSLYGELFGLKEDAGERQSLFRYFHGRSSLATWLRAILAQRHVDRFRDRRRFDPLPDDQEPVTAQVGDLHDTQRSQHEAVMRDALGKATARLSARDRLRLACYYAQNLTLAQIGRSTGEHEATVSRHLARTRRMVRNDVEHQLRHTFEMSDAEIAECFASAARDPGALDISELVRTDDDPRKETTPDRST